MLFRRLRCSFCRRPDKDVDKLVAGARGYICDRCAREVMRIIETTPTPPPPQQETLARSMELERASVWNRAWHFAVANGN